MFHFDCAVIEFLVKEENSAAEIHLRLQRAYRDVYMGTSSLGYGWNISKMGTRVSKMSLMRAPSNCFHGTQQGKSWRRQACHCEWHRCETCNRTQCSARNDSKLRLSKGMCPLGLTLISRRPQTSEKNHLGENFFHILPTVLNWHPLTTIFSVQWRNRCEANVTRHWRIFCMQCISIYGQLEWSYITRVFSNLQNDGENVWKKWRLCWKVAIKSVD